MPASLDPNLHYGFSYAGEQRGALPELLKAPLASGEAKNGGTAAAGIYDRRGNFYGVLFC